MWEIDLCQNILCPIELIWVDLIVIIYNVIMSFKTSYIIADALDPCGSQVISNHAKNFAS